MRRGGESDYYLRQDNRAFQRVSVDCPALVVFVIASCCPARFAYIQFQDKESVEKALKLDDSTFRGRQLKVLPKRQNLPAVMRGGGRGRGGRGFPGRGGRIPGGGRFPAGGYYAGGRFPGGGRGGRFPGRYPGRFPGGRGRGRGGYFYSPY